MRHLIRLIIAVIFRNSKATCIQPTQISLELCNFVELMEIMTKEKSWGWIAENVLYFIRFSSFIWWGGQTGHVGLSASSLGPQASPCRPHQSQELMERAFFDHILDIAD